MIYSKIIIEIFQLYEIDNVENVKFFGYNFDSLPNVLLSFLRLHLSVSILLHRFSSTYMMFCIFTFPIPKIMNIKSLEYKTKPNKEFTLKFRFTNACE